MLVAPYPPRPLIFRRIAVPEKPAEPDSTPEFRKALLAVLRPFHQIHDLVVEVFERFYPRGPIVLCT